MSRIHARYTPTRHRWLRSVAKGVGVDSRGRGPTGYHCMQLGWTEWKRGASGLIVGEQLTDAGRDLLRTWERNEKLPEDGVA